MSVDELSHCCSARNGDNEALAVDLINLRLFPGMWITLSNSFTQLEAVNEMKRVTRPVMSPSASEQLSRH